KIAALSLARSSARVIPHPPVLVICMFSAFPVSSCYVDDKVSRVAWLNRSNIIFAGQDKWSLDPRVDLVTKGQLEYSLRIQKVDVYDEGSYTCSIQTKQKPKTSHVYLIVQVPASIYKVSEDVIVNEGSNVTLSCLASGRPDPIITWRLLNPSGESQPIRTHQRPSRFKGRLPLSGGVIILPLDSDSEMTPVRDGARYNISSRPNQPI
uniref:Ig-like domain-containing protein n=1 Tax=Periophthalmus magnuspinnatus TaxID=409849 RepID=A0A3B4BD97_9GOBI